MNLPLLTVALPQYRVDSEPDHGTLGRAVDAEIRQHFMGRTVLIRGVGIQDHPGISVEQLIELIERNGTDRYDPTRTGDRYANVQGRHIDLFAFRRKVTPRMRVQRPELGLLPRFDRDPR